MRWFIIQGGRESGPFTPDQLRKLVVSGKLRPDHVVRPETDQRQFKASQVSTLFPELWPKFGSNEIPKGTKRPVNINTGTEPAPYGSIRPSDGYLAGIWRIATRLLIIPLVGLLVVALSLCGTPNTRIGWPGFYWEHGGLSFMSYLAVCILIGVSGRVMIGTLMDHSIDRQKVEQRFFGVLIPLVIAAVLLQFLPNTRSGVQFLPCTPWSFSGWIPFSIAAICCLWFLIGCLIVLSCPLDRDSAISFVMLVMLGLNALLSFWGMDYRPKSWGTTGTVAVEPTPSNEPLSQIDELKGRIGRWKESKAKLAALIAGLQRERVSLLGELDRLGVKSVGEGVTNPKAKVLLEELRDILRQLALYQRKDGEYELAILKSESRVRTIERRLSAKDAGVSKAELEQLTRSMVTLDESLASETRGDIPVELDAVLAEYLADPKKSRHGSSNPIGDSPP